jgi:hypothetical protein
MKKTVLGSVPDPDPPDPHVFGPPGSGSFYHHAKKVRKTLISYYFVTQHLYEKRKESGAVSGSVPLINGSGLGRFKKHADPDPQHWKKRIFGITVPCLY